MWPWEHAAVGYLLFSLVVHVLYRRSPVGAGALLLLFATQLPDLVDKPLSWGLDLFPAGFSVAHSVFVAVPVGIAGAWLLARTGRRDAAVALVVGYWSHLVGDVVSPLRAGDPLAPDRLLWPVVRQEPYGEDLGLGRGLVYVREYVAEVASQGLTPALALSAAALFLAVALWVVDGLPGLGWLHRAAVGQQGRK